MTISYSIFKIYLLLFRMNNFFGFVTHGACGTIGWNNWHVCISIVHFLCFVFESFVRILLHYWKEILLILIVFYVLEKNYVSSLLYLLSHISHFWLLWLPMPAFDTRYKDLIWNAQCCVFALPRLWWIHIIYLIR
jgi:hypothetical protein